MTVRISRLIAALLFIAALYLARDVNALSDRTADPAVYATVLATSAQIAAGMLAFMLAALAILASISSSYLLKQMRATGHYTDLLSRIFDGFVAFTMLAVLSTAMLIFGISSPWARWIYVSIHLPCLVFLMDIGHKFYLTLVNLRVED